MRFAALDGRNQRRQIMAGVRVLIGSGFALYITP